MMTRCLCVKVVLTFTSVNNAIWIQRRVQNREDGDALQTAPGAAEGGNMTELDIYKMEHMTWLKSPVEVEK